MAPQKQASTERISSRGAPRSYWIVLLVDHQMGLDFAMHILLGRPDAKSGSHK